MRRTILLMLVTAALAGCGSQPGGQHPVAAPSGCVTPKLTGPRHSFTITEKDGGQSFCVTTGTGVFVFLHGTPTWMWTHLSRSSPALQPRASGEMTLKLGVTGGFFVASSPGTTVLTSTRPSCRGCRGPTTFRVTVVVRGRT